MKICLITDQHFGARSDSITFSDYFERFYTEIFFPFLASHKIDRVIDLGDTFDRRKFINFDSLHRCKNYWFEALRKNNIHLDMLIGNHDTYFKNTNDVNSPNLLLGEYDNITVYDKPTEIEIDGTQIAMLPWICSGNYQQSLDFIEKTRAQILFGHLELKGFEMHRGAVNDNGMDVSLFDKFDIVCSGHFHHKSSRGNINYLGAPYEMTWSDYNDQRGFHIFDTDTRELQFIQNPLTMFNKIHYNDSKMQMEDIIEKDFSKYKHSFCKVIVQNKSNPYWFDMFINKLESSGVSDLQVVEDHLNLNLTDDSDIINEAEDTLTILRKVVNSIDSSNVSKKDLDKLLTSLYTEAMHAE
jgi:DNA repair exonuclease SbcCD nuclease subunit